MKYTCTLWLLWACFYCTLSIAQIAPTDLPSNAQAGKCYMKCVVSDADLYESVTEQVLVKEGSTKIEITPAVYEEVEVKIVTKEGYKVLNVIPPMFEIVEEKILVKDSTIQWTYRPPTFEAVTEQVLIQPATIGWMKAKPRNYCLSEKEAEACETWCCVENMPQYQTITRQILKTPARTTPTTVPAEYKTISKALVSQTAQIVEKEIPEEYRTLTKKVLLTPITTKEVEVPPVYSYITTQKMVKGGCFVDWVEVNCATSSPQRVAQIQKALKERGYDPGPINNILGSKTREALLQYQKNHGLPTGQVSIETIRSLGLWD